MISKLKNYRAVCQCAHYQSVTAHSPKQMMGFESAVTQVLRWIFNICKDFCLEKKYYYSCRDVPIFFIEHRYFLLRTCVFPFFQTKEFEIHLQIGESLVLCVEGVNSNENRDFWTELPKEVVFQFTLFIIMSQYKYCIVRLLYAGYRQGERS